MPVTFHWQMKSFKVVVVGDSGVGKTCIVNRAQHGTFSEETPMTVGAIVLHLHPPSGTDVTFEIWDTAGQEAYRTLIPMYYRGAAAAIVCFDLTRRTSFASLDQWVESVRQGASADCEVIILGNKADLAGAREVQFDEADDARFRLNANLFMEVSAKTGQNITEVFERLAEDFGGKIGLPTQLPATIALEDTQGGEAGYSCC
jgi:small GTP-binding protein